MPGRKHSHDHFFKYTSLETALQVIASKSFRWSSPTKFNDPFDHQTGFTHDIDVEQFAILLASATERLIFGDFVPQAHPSLLLPSLGLQLRSIRDSLPREEILRKLRESSIQVAENLQDGIDQLNTMAQHHLSHSRVFCVSERNDNIVMWSHYSGEHRGVMFKLRCIDELDNMLLAAQPVSYVDAFTAFPSANAYAKHLTGEEQIDFASLIQNMAFTKHADWSYEKEWRVHRPLLDEPEGDGYTIYPEHPKVFEAVYLGCRMDHEDIERVKEAVRLHLPDTRVYRAERSYTSFALSFVEI